MKWILIISQSAVIKRIIVKALDVLSPHAVLSTADDREEAIDQLATGRDCDLIICCDPSPSDRATLHFMHLYEFMCAGAATRPHFMDVVFDAETHAPRHDETQLVWPLGDDAVSRVAQAVGIHLDSPSVGGEFGNETLPSLR